MNSTNTSRSIKFDVTSPTAQQASVEIDGGPDATIERAVVAGRAMRDVFAALWNVEASRIHVYVTLRSIRSTVLECERVAE